MSSEEFAAACAAIETIALNNQLMLEHNYGTSRDKVQEVVNLARTQWFKDNNAKHGRGK